MATLTRRPRSVKPAHGTARLTLPINGTAYAVRSLAADPSAAHQVVRLRKADGTTYHVARTARGAECDCPDFIWNRDGRDSSGCKHIKALVSVGLLASEG